MIEKTATGIHRVGRELRVAEIRSTGRKITILRLDRRELSSAPLPPAKGSADSVTIASVPASDVLTRFWTLPHAGKNQFQSILTHRLEADLPIPVEELTWGHRTAEDSRSSHEGDPILVQAVKSSQVSRHLSDFASAGIDLDILTTETEAVGALYRYGFYHLTEPGSDALILATAAEWLLAVITNGLVRSLRRIRVVDPAGHSALLETRQTLEKELPSGQLRQILWCASADLSLTPDQIRTLTGLTVTRVELSDGLLASSESPPGDTEIAVFGPAIGLALAGVFEKDKIIRLMTREKQELSSRQKQIHRLIAHPLRWTAAALILMVLAAWIHVGSLHSENRKMRVLLNPVENAKLPIVTLEPRVQALQRLAKYRVNALGVVLDICRALPESIVVTSIQLSREQKLVLKGTSKDPKAVFSFADTLRKSNRLAAINPERTEPGQGGGFTITAQLAGVQKISTISERSSQWK
jgi:hypothetical protein